MKRAVLFDLDGTLLDTLEDLADSGNTVLRRHGYDPHPSSAYRMFVGDGMSKLVERIFPPGAITSPEDFENKLDDYKAAYEGRWRNKTRVYEGIEELLEKLSRLGVKTGVLTNKAHPFAVKCVSEFFPGHVWDVVSGQREGVPPKPDAARARRALEEIEVEASEALFVGDSSVDMKTAVNAGMMAVGVSWGFRDREELISSGATVLIDKPLDLLKIL